MKQKKITLGVFCSNVESNISEFQTYFHSSGVAYRTPKEWLKVFADYLGYEDESSIEEDDHLEIAKYLDDERPIGK